MILRQMPLVCQYDVVCFDEVSGISFDQKDGVNIMKGYMESGEFSRGKESIRADGSIVLVGNFEVDVENQQRIGHLFGPLPPEMRNDTAFMDRIHAFLPGWDVPKINKDLLTNHFGLVSDFLSECWTQLRNQSRVSELQNRVYFGGALSGRDTNAVNKTVSGLLKLLYPSGEDVIPEEDLEWAVRIAMESRRRVKEQQKRVGAAEFRNTHFSYTMGADGVEKFVSTPELQSDNSIGGDPLEPGQVWSISAGGNDENSGLYRVDVNEGPGSGVKVLNKPISQAFRESIGFAEQNLYARSVQLVGDKDPRQHEFTVQLRAFDAARSGAKLGVASLVALCTSLLKRSVRGGLIIVGEINLGGSIEPVHNAVTIAEIAVEKGATALLMPVACRRQLVPLHRGFDRLAVGRAQDGQVVGLNQKSDAACNPGLPGNQSCTLQGEHHLMNSGRRHLEIALEIGFRRCTAKHLGISVDEGKILPLLFRERRCWRHQARAYLVIHRLSPHLGIFGGGCHEYTIPGGVKPSRARTIERHARRRQGSRAQDQARPDPACGRRRRA